MADSRFRGRAGGVSSLGLHRVWCPTYRRRLLGGRVAIRLVELVGQIGTDNDGQMVAKGVMAERVHLFVGVRPIGAPAGVVRGFRGRTARVLRQELRWLARSKVLCSPSYLAASVGSEAAVRRYIEQRWDGVV